MRNGCEPYCKIIWSIKGCSTGFESAAGSFTIGFIERAKLFRNRTSGIYRLFETKSYFRMRIFKKWYVYRSISVLINCLILGISALENKLSQQETNFEKTKQEMIVFISEKFKAECTKAYAKALRQLDQKNLENNNQLIQYKEKVVKLQQEVTV
jgi:hypothetical protein